MFTKQNLLATLAGFAVMFVLGYVIWGLATVDFFEAHTVNDVMKEMPDMVILALSNLIAVFALSSIYGKWARGHHSAKDGFQFGAWIGLFAGIGLGLLWYSTSEIFDLTGQLVNGVIEIIFYGLIGMTIAVVYKKTAGKEAS
ncbi:MAG TPA: hypothetical protein VKN36_16160 [Eudoraea sp.]|nr:hypothetical protein [Eudoraea sp.]